MEPRQRRNDVLVPLSVLVGVVAILGGLLQVTDRMLGLERRLTSLEVRTEILLQRVTEQP